MHTFTGFIRYLRFTEGLSTSDLFGWLLAALAGIIAYKLIDNMQTSIERHNMLSAVEDKFSELYDSLIAFRVNKGEKLTEENSEKYLVMVRSVLHDESDWQIIEEKSGGSASKEGADKPSGEPVFDVQMLNHQRYVHIRDNGEWDEWISTQALHEICLKTRRIEKMYKGGIIKPLDLSDMFREIIPLGMSGRPEFFRKYYSDYDAECIAYLVMQTVVACDKSKNHDIINSFVTDYNKRPDIHVLFENNRRIKSIRDRMAQNRFRQITGRQL